MTLFPHLLLIVCNSSIQYVGSKLDTLPKGVSILGVCFRSASFGLSTVVEGKRSVGIEKLKQGVLGRGQRISGFRREIILSY